MRRLTVLCLTLAAILFFSDFAAADEATLQPGDKGYKHVEGGELHEAYQKFFDQSQCSCSSGECRPTQFRFATPPADQADIMSAYQVKVNGRFCFVPKQALVTKDDVDPEVYRVLARYDAHVCAYTEETRQTPNGLVAVSETCPTIGCAHIPFSQ